MVKTRRYKTLRRGQKRVKRSLRVKRSIKRSIRRNKSKVGG